MFSHNIGTFKLSHALKQSLLVLAAVVVVWCILHKALGYPAKARLITSLSVLLFFSYGLARMRIGPEWAAHVSGVWAAGFFTAVFLVASARRDLRATENVTATIGAILMVTVIAPIGWSGVIGLATVRLQSEGEINPATAVRFQALAPDIYFIVVDAYGRADTLGELYDYDNREFLGFLRGRGFFVAEKATSQYAVTRTSLSSCLNLSYLQKDKPTGVKRLIDWHQVESLIDDSRAERFLRRCGYKVIAFESGIFLTELRGSDVYVRTGGTIDAFANTLLNMTPIPEFMCQQSDTNPFNVHRARIEYLLDHIPDAAALAPAPRFVFAHIPAPRPPFVFGSTGERLFPSKRFLFSDGAEVVHDGGLGYAGYAQGYRDQLAFLNSRLCGMVDAILSRSEQPPVIILVGDHGPRPRMRLDEPGQGLGPEAYNVLCALH
ncbi:MAG TPA: hypothetical protein VFD43_05910, partial [Planctomycetota bacterium]|nr:hypothetical protein [Planctomycetota bacterium]